MATRPRIAVSAPIGTLSMASATGTSYGVEVPLRLRIDSVAASAPPRAPSTPTTRMSALCGWESGPWLVGQA